MLQKSCAPLTSDFFFSFFSTSLLHRASSRRSWCSQLESKPVSMWRLKGCVTHSPMCSIAVAECCNITHRYLLSCTYSTLGYFKITQSVRCHAAKTDLDWHGNAAPFHHLSFFLLFYLKVVYSWVWVGCSDAAVQPNPTLKTRWLSLNVVNLPQWKERKKRRKVEKGGFQGI